MVHTVWKKRAIAAVMSVAMLGTSMAATRSFGLLETKFR